MPSSLYTSSHEPKLLQCIALRGSLARRRGSAGQPALDLLFQSSLLGASTRAKLNRLWPGQVVAGIAHLQHCLRSEHCPRGHQHMALLLLRII